MSNRAVPGKNDLATTHPALAAELVDQELGRALKAGSTRKVLWRCALGHQWEARLDARTGQGQGCPFCAGRYAIPGVNDLATTHPALAAELVDQELATVLKSGSHRMVEWCCALGHEWRASLLNRCERPGAPAQGCPVCSGKRVLPGFNDLATTHPELAQELVDQELATVLSAGSNRVVEWRCALGHEWTTRPGTRTRANQPGCPTCAGKRVLPGFNDLATTHPTVAAELVDQELARVLSAGQIRKVRWRCALGHEWMSSPNNRTSRPGGGCPECAPHGFSQSSPGWLYLLRTEAGTVYKFGITNNLDERLRKHEVAGFPVVVETWLFDFGGHALAAETLLLQFARANGWSPAMSRSSMPDGWSETLSAYDCGPDFSLRPFVEQVHAESD